MLFNSIDYLIFLPSVFIGYWFIIMRLFPLRQNSNTFGSASGLSKRCVSRANSTLHNLFIVAVSYLFYGWWDWRFLLLIAFTSLCSYASGILLERFDNRRTARKWICTGNIVINLAILGVFKYFNFFSENIRLLLHTFGFEADWFTIDILLPVGISFYTFQALSYSIDVYRRDMAPTHDIVAFFAFISFFPQLVAGPIERATDLLPQFLSPRTFDCDKAVDGMRRILWGLFKKIIVADNCAVIVGAVFGNYQSVGGLQLLAGGIFFAFQIYGDFSGYSDIAIGSARLFGIELRKNFDYPYFSRDIAEFWRRWHISLNTWFRDYIYIPLGGSREGRLKSIRNTFVIFIVSGLWHGANWTFVCWGLYHAVLFLPLLLLGRNRRFRDTVAEGRLLPSLDEAVRMVVTFLLVTVGWIIFRAENIGQAADYLARMFSMQRAAAPVDVDMLETSIYILLLLAVEWLQRGRAHGLDLSAVKYRSVRVAIYTVVILIIELAMGETSDFIYFQF